MEYTETMEIHYSANDAWLALSNMDQWLPNLSTISDIKYDTNTPFFIPRKKYKIYTPEKIIMNAQIISIDSQELKVIIHAKFSLLKSKLMCQVVPINQTTCSIIRTQNYPGIIGEFFTRIKHKREAAETQEYLQEWARFIQTKNN